MAFDPDKYLEESNKPQGSFDPDKYLAEEPKKDTGIYEEYVKPYLKPTVEALGATAGGLLGAGAGFGIGSIPGAITGSGLGYAGAKRGYEALENLIQGKTPQEGLKEQALGTLKDIGTGATYEMGGQIGSKALQSAVASLPKLAKGAVKSLYDIPPEAAEYIAKNPKRVESAMQESTFSGGKKLLDKVQGAINNKVTTLNQGIDSSLQQAQAEGKKISIDPVIARMKETLSKFKAITPSEVSQASELKNQIGLLEGYRSKMGSEVSPIEANRIKRLLQEEAFPQSKDTGIKYSRTDEVGKALKDSSKLLREEIEKIAPEVGENNKQLQKLLEFQTDSKFTNAFAPQNIEQTMKTVQGSGNKGYLKEVIDKADDILGTDIADTTKDFYAAKYLRDPETLSAFRTGRGALPSTIGASLGGTIGAGLGGYSGAGIGAPIGALAMQGLASPQIFKAIAPKALPIQKGIEGLLPYAQTLGRGSLFEGIRDE